MLSELSYSSLEQEIQFLRVELNSLAMDLNIQEIYRSYYNPAVTDSCEWKRALYYWKRTRLEALEMFAHAQYVISDMMQPGLARFGNNQRKYKINRRPKKKNQKTNPDPRNVTQDGNKVNQLSSTQALTSQVETNKTHDSQEIKIKTEATDNTQFFNTLKNIKKENIDHEHESVLNNNIDSNFIPQLLPVKIEVDCSIVKNEENESRKRKMSRNERCSKRARIE